MTYPRGHIPDHDAVVDARTGFHLHPEYGAIRSQPTLPLFTSNRALLPRDKGGPGLRNQFDASGCEGCANSSGGTVQLALDGTRLAEPISHIGTYYGGLMCDAPPPNPDGTLPPLLDVGTMPSSILSGWQLFGGSAESAWGQLPMSSRTMYIDPSGQNPAVPQGALIQPTPNQLYAGRSCRLNGAYFLTSGGVALVRDVMRCLSAKKVLTNAIPASGDAFQGYMGGVLGALDGPIDHAQLAIDYTWTGTQAQLDAFLAGDDSLVTLVILHGVNSWGGAGCPDGGTWGELDSINNLGGQYRADANFIKQAADWAVLDLTRVS